MEEKNIMVLWDFVVENDRKTDANWPEIIIKYFKERTLSKYKDPNIKLSKYKDLETEVTKMWKLKTKTIPVVIRALRMIQKGTQKYMEIPGKPSLQEMQELHGHYSTFYFKQYSQWKIYNYLKIRYTFAFE